MAKTGLLNALQVERAKQPGRLCDGGGLYLQIKPTGSKSWLFRYKVDRDSKMIGLGPFPDLSLAQARDLAAGMRNQRARGLDPILERKAEQERQRIAAAQAVTFREVSEKVLEQRKAEWKTPKQEREWKKTLEKYVHGKIGKLPVGAISTRDILEVLQQPVPEMLSASGALLRPAGIFWNVRPETARRVRSRIEDVLDWARLNEYRKGDNPARWEGNLNQRLKAATDRRHHPALPYAELPDFLKELRGQAGMAAAALEFLILTAARTGEVLGARWSEIDELGAVWRVPAERMKMKKEHRVPLSKAALAVLARLRPQARGDVIFPGFRTQRSDGAREQSFEPKPLSNMALLVLLRRMGRTDITPHGMRSSFRDWCAEETDFPHEVAEMALAHAVSDAVEKAYRRGDLFKKREMLMQAFANYCDGVTNVVAHPRAA